MKKIILTFSLFLAYFSNIAQTGTEFWFAPPDVTFSHNSPGGVPIYLNMSTLSQSVTVTLDQPANPGFTPIVIAIPANSSHQEDLSAFVADLETAPTNSVLNTGLRITSTDTIAAYYEVSNTNNSDIFALKGKNSLGQEFYIPLHNHAPFYNHNTYSAPNLAYASFDIVATENNTTVMIYSPTAVDGSAALTPFTITLNEGQTYSCGWTGANYHLPSNHPSGAVVISDKDVAITIKDDSNHNPSGGCYDLLGDQIVPVGIIGSEYIAIKGQLNATGDESVFVLATENNTQVFIDGSATPITTLFAGQTYRYDMDYLFGAANNATYIVCSKPAYVTHVTGFGCEQGQAILPPLNCAGSEQIAFTRSTNEGFFLNILVKTASVNDFTMTHSGAGTGTINPTSFTVVPGTGGIWMAGQIQYTAGEIPVNQGVLVSNSSDVFSLAIINGGASSGCRYGFFSEFAGEILIDAGVDATVCANDTAQLGGSVQGGTTTGMWTSSGSGQFLPNDTDLNAEYVPSPADISAGTVTITLVSTGNCTPVSDDLVMSITPAPIADAGVDANVCENNASINLNGTVTIASGGYWTGGAGSYAPNNTSLITTYTPSAGELTAGSVTLTLHTSGNGTCNEETDNVTYTFTPAPTVDAGIAQTLCGNNADASLSGAVTVATGGIWSGGLGTFSPNVNALNATYSPDPSEITGGSVVLTLSSTGNGLCSQVSDNVTLTYSAAPTANAGSDVIRCANNAAVSLAGSVTVATGGLWSGGAGTYVPNANTLNAVYTPSAAEITAGTTTLTLTTSGNGNCNSVNDQMVITITAAPTVNAGADETVCANNPDVTLAGSVTIATGGVWSGGTGTYAPNPNTLNTLYTPSASEITAGTVTLTLTTTGNATCNSENDQMVITITTAPTVSAGADQSLCGNNADATLAGSITIASGGVWTGGSGSFAPNANALNAVYSPSAGEITAGSVTLTLTSSGNGTCTAVSDNATLTYSAIPTASAGSDEVRCANNATVALNGSVTVATGGLWSGGAGTYVPNANTLNAVYTPSAAEITAGTTTLTLTTTGNGSCNPVADNMTITFTTAPTVSAGADQSVCANSPDVTLAGSVTVATGGAWSGGAGTYIPNPNTLNAVYTPSASEITAGTVTLTLTTTGNASCNSENDQMVITITTAPTVIAGADQSLCGNNADATLAGSITIASGGIWTGGSGSFAPNANALNAVYSPSAGEITSGAVTLTLTSTGNGNCTAVADNVTLTYTTIPTANAGADEVRCANNASVALSGSVTTATGGVWSGGLGIFSPSSTALNATYTPTAAEISSGTLTLTLSTSGVGNCTNVSDDMDITFTAGPTVSAGTDQTVCANSPNVTLGGSVTIATGGAWTGGTGTFTPNANDLNAVYTPSNSEITTGTLTLTLTTTGNATCSPETDQMTITITQSPIVSAGVDQSACANNADVSLLGSVSNAGGGSWTGGSGTFNPSNTALNAVYTPTPAEITAGSVSLTLTSTTNGLCNAENDAMLITFTPAPIVNAGSDQTICANNANVTLSGSVTGATGGSWTGGLGVFTPNNTTLNAVYSPTAAEIASGNLTLTLNSTGNSNCNQVQDNIAITFTAAPTVNAGPDAAVCANAASVNLSGTITIASGAVWLNGNGTYAPNATDLNAVYTPSATEIAAGIVTLTLQTTGMGNCSAETDQITITIDPQPTTNAGPNQTSCANNPNINLAGIVTNAAGGIWSGGSGSFNPNATDLNGIYTPSAAEISAGMATLTLTSTGNGSCNATADQFIITIVPAPIADADVDQSVCSNNSDVTLSGSVTGASGGTWSGGLGLFTPSANALNAVYSPTAGEVASGTLTLTLTTSGNGSCSAETDNMVVTYTASPTVIAGADLTSCANNPDVTLSGAVGVASGGLWSGGAGIFTPSNTDLNAVYTPSFAEITAGSVVLTLTTTGNLNCSPEQDNLTVSIDPIPTANAGPDATVCVTNMTVALSGSISGITNTGQWSTSGSGTFVPNNTSLNADYTPSAADSIAGAVTLTLTTTNNQACLPISDDMLINILPAGIASAGADETVCANNASVNLSGTVSGGATTGVWSSSGTGVFTPNNTDLNATYVPSANDASTGTVTITLTANSCDSDTDDMVITITPEPIVSAGPDETVCANVLTISLTGSVTGASTTGVWSTSGTGTFSPSNTDLNATYTASSADSIAQTVTIVLNATGIGTCVPVSDTMLINIFPTGTANAGSDQTLCANNGNVTLSGTISGGASQGQWSTTGSGVFVPNNTDLNATYVPSSADTINGSVSLTLSATNSCNAATDFMVVTFSPAPAVNAGPDQSLCATNPVVSIAGTVNVATSAEWSTSGSGTFSPNNASLNATYNATPTDISNGTITLYLTSIGNGSCNAVIDSLIVNISTGVVVNAGSDQIVCSTSAYTSLQGQVSNGSTTGVWSTLGSGTFAPNSATLSVDYSFSPADVSSGSTQLILTSTNNGSCAAEADTLVVTYGSTAYAGAGSDQIVCVDNFVTNLNGIISGGATQGQWLTLGSGAFFPSNTDLNASYTPSASDSVAGFVDIVLETIDHGSCAQGKDTMRINIEPLPIANAGVDVSICTAVDSVILSGGVTSAIGATWTTSGTGFFTPNDSLLNAAYHPSLSDIATGNITLSLTTYGSSICSADTDEMQITLVMPLSAGFTFTETCIGLPMSFSDTSLVVNGTIVSWAWNFGDAGVSASQNPVHIYNATGTYDVTLVVESSLGCSYTIIQTVTVHAGPNANFGINPNPADIDEEISFNDLSTGSISWIWSFGNGDSDSVNQQPTYVYFSEGNYNITQTVTNVYGCTDTMTQALIVRESAVYPPVVPTGFSPNEDGENDVLRVLGGPFLEVNLRVYNNWGNLIFESNDPAMGWNGAWKDKQQPPGDYVFVVRAVTIDGEEYFNQGSVSIIK
jgi:gliding motility-associated-like protein